VDHHVVECPFFFAKSSFFHSEYRTAVIVKGSTGTPFSARCSPEVMNENFIRKVDAN
jgi:hypothetical protein